MQQKIFVYDPTALDKLSSVRGVGRYLQILKENFPEWIYVNNETIKRLNNNCIFINPFFNFLQPPLTLKKIAQKQIAVIHDLIPLKYSPHFPAGIKGSIYILLNKLSLKNYDLIITDSEASKTDVINILHIKENKIKVIYPCLPKVFIESQNLKAVSSFPRKRESIFLDPLLQGDDTEFCLYVGDATWNKNLVNLAKAIKIANVTCIFVGKIFGSKTRELVNSLNNKWLFEFQQFLIETKNDKRFIFAGFISDSQLIKFYQQALVNILPSRDEGFGFSYVESSQFGCPSLLSNIPVLREISDGKALFFDPKNPADMADKIKEICTDKNLRNKIVVGAKKRSEFFSAKKFKEEFLSVI